MTGDGMRQDESAPLAATEEAEPSPEPRAHAPAEPAPETRDASGPADSPPTSDGPPTPSPEPPKRRAVDTEALTRWGLLLALPVGALAILNGVLDVPTKLRAWRSAAPPTEEVAPSTLLSLRILDAESHQPLSAVSIRLPALGLETRTDDQGVLRLPVPVAPESLVRVVAEKEGYGRFEREVPAGLGQTTWLARPRLD